MFLFSNFKRVECCLFCDLDVINSKFCTIIGHNFNLATFAELYALLEVNSSLCLIVRILAYEIRRSYTYNINAAYCPTKFAFDLANGVLKGILRYFKSLVKFYPYFGKNISLGHTIRERGHIKVVRLVIVDYPYLGVLVQLVEDVVLLEVYSTEPYAKGELLIIIVLEILDNLRFKFLLGIYNV